MLLSDPSDVATLASNMTVALTDSAARARLVAAGSVRWREFTWQKCAAELAGVYQKVADSDTDGWL